MLLSDVLLLNYKRCQRRAFLNIHGDLQFRDRPNDFLLKLRRESQKHALEVLDRFYPNYCQPSVPKLNGKLNTLLAKARATKNLMARGENYIHQAVLLSRFEKIGAIGTVSLLVKQPGESNFGDWTYLPVSIQLGRRPKSEYKLLAAFYAHLLAEVQGVLPNESKIILRRHDTYKVNLDYWLPQMQTTVAECIDLLSQDTQPEVFISRQRCSLCSWYNYCYDRAKSEAHLSLVPGVTPKRYQHIVSLGLNSLESLASSSPLNLGETIGIEIASQLKQQALSILENRPLLRLNNTDCDYGNIPTAAVELYFDIEAEPERNLDYLLGVLLVDRQTNEQQFYYFLAETPEQEKNIWQQFLNLVEFHSRAPIFHFSGYEVETILRLARLYDTPPTQTKLILSRCVDLHREVTTSVTLPVESYSLKSVANWLGFQWRDPGVSGEQSVCWYDRWLQTGDRSLLDSILRYNEDDCRATYHLKDWLTNFLGNNSLLKSRSLQ